MKNKSRSYIRKLKLWINNNYKSVAIISIVQIFILFAFRLPYLNVVGASFSFIPYLVLIAMVIFFYKPSARIFLIVSLVLFGVSAIFSLLQQRAIVTVIGNMCYFLLGTYFFKSIHELRQ